MAIPQISEVTDSNQPNRRIIKIGKFELDINVSEDGLSVQLNDGDLVVGEIFGDF